MKNKIRSQPISTLCTIYAIVPLYTAIGLDVRLQLRNNSIGGQSVGSPAACNTNRMAIKTVTTYFLPSGSARGRGSGWGSGGWLKRTTKGTASAQHKAHGTRRLIVGRRKTREPCERVFRLPTVSRSPGGFGGFPPVRRDGLRRAMWGVRGVSPRHAPLRLAQIRAHVWLVQEYSIHRQ